MFRIKLASGEETVFGSVAELAQGIQSGQVTARALIYHQRSEKWVPITVHPAYKSALESGANPASQAPSPTSTAVVEPPRTAPPPSRPAAPALKLPTFSPPSLRGSGPRAAIDFTRKKEPPASAAPKAPAPPSAPIAPLPVPSAPIDIAELLELEPPALRKAEPPAPVAATPAEPPPAPTPPLPPVPAPPIAISPLDELEPLVPVKSELPAPVAPEAGVPIPVQPLPPVPAPPIAIAPLTEVEPPDPAPRTAEPPAPVAPKAAEPPPTPIAPLLPVPAPPIAIAPLIELEPTVTPEPSTSEAPKAAEPAPVPIAPLPPVPAPPIAIAPLLELEPLAPVAKAEEPPPSPVVPLPPVPAPPIAIAPLPEVEPPAPEIRGLITQDVTTGLELDQASPAKGEPAPTAEAVAPSVVAPSGDEPPALLVTSDISLSDITTRRSGPQEVVAEAPRPRTSGPIAVFEPSHAPARRKPPVVLIAAVVLVLVAALATWRLLRAPSAPAAVESSAVKPPAPARPAAATPRATQPPATAPAAHPLLTPDSLARRYASAQDSARGDFDTALVRIHFGRLLVPERLGSTDSLKLAHQVISTAVGVLGAYRAKSAAIEKAFQDSASALALRQTWTAADLNAWKVHPSRLEPTDMARLTDSLLANVDGVYQVMISQAGQYDYTPASIAFLNPESMQKYAGHRSWLTRRVSALNTMPSGKLSPVLATVLRAVGLVNLPAAFAKEPVIPNAPDLPKDSGN